MATKDPRIDTRYATDKLRVTYPHVGLFNVLTGDIWVAKKKGLLSINYGETSHAQLFKGGTPGTSVEAKDSFVCFWFHTPGSGSGPIHGYPIEWDEGHLMVRLEPQWSYTSLQMIPSVETAKIEKNIDQQFDWGQKLFKRYVEAKPKFPLSWHLMGPRPADSEFYIERHEP